MRIFEILAAIFLILLLFIPTRIKRDSKIQSPFLLLLIGSICLVLLFHIAFEGVRWQMGFLYAAVFVAGIVVAREQVFMRFNRNLHLGMAVFASFCLVLSLIFGFIFPVFRLPAPGGPYPVGFTRIHIETGYSRQNGGSNELYVYYPASGADIDHASKKAPYWRDPVTMSTWYKPFNFAPDFSFRHFELIETHSISDAVPASEDNSGFPVIFALHGGGQNAHPANLVHLNENLASHGYIVIAVAVPGISLITEQADGSTVYSIPDLWTETSTLPDEVRNRNAQNWIDSIGKPLEQQRQAFSEFTKGFESYQNLVLNRSANLIQMITGLQKSQDLYPALIHGDLGNIGVYGYSLGGAAALYSLINDNRIRAGANLDGFYFAPLPSPDVQVESPVLMLLEEPVNEWTRDQYRALTPHFSGPLAMFSVTGASHSSFGHDYLFSPLAGPLGFIGSIPGKQINSLTSDYLLWFFEAALKDRYRSVPDYSEAVPEVLSGFDGS